MFVQAFCDYFMNACELPLLCICDREDNKERLPPFLRVGRCWENVFLSRTKLFQCVCVCVWGCWGGRPCVCYCDILNVSLSSVHSSAVGPVGHSSIFLVFAVGYGDPDWHSLPNPGGSTCLIGSEQI